VYRCNIHTSIHQSAYTLWQKEQKGIKAHCRELL